jgi:hypothetical protein
MVNHYLEEYLIAKRSIIKQTEQLKPHSTTEEDSSAEALLSAGERSETAVKCNEDGSVNDAQATRSGDSIQYH